MISLNGRNLYNKYFFLTLIQYIASILIIMIHCGRIFPPPVDFFFRSLICKMAVPLFLISTGYFVRKKILQNENYKKIWWKRQIKNYFFLSIIYLPLGLMYIHQKINLSLTLYPVALLLGIGYLGTYYHLWYFPALFLGIVWVGFGIKRLGYKLSIILFALLYSFGLLETYSSYLKNMGIEQVFYVYKKYFFTPRNGIFYTPLFILLGFLVCDFQKHSFLTNQIKKKLFFCTFLMILEGSTLYINQGLDTNFLFSLPLFSLFLFLIYILLHSSLLLILFYYY
ncbi:MAG: acyltransferase, partial [Lactobacillales bacterium]|nr:acyltransferase [Lactobacillales bacterium]